MFSICSFLLFQGCKKDSKNEATKNATREELTKDSIFLYAKETYLWNSDLPSYDQFKPRSFASFGAELNALTNYQPLDKYSFLDDGSLAEELGGVSGDFGFSLNYSGGNANDLRVTYVYENSPAFTKGLKRGYRITKINGRTDLDGTKQATIDFLNDAIYSSKTSVDLTLQRFDGSQFDVTVSKGTYTVNPIISSNVFTVGTKKVGYFVLNSFVRISGSNAANAFKTKLDELFAYFQNQNITELVVDLRYNGGGSVETADYLVNYIAPPATTGIMHVDHYNQLMQKNQATILQNQKFTYQGQQYSMFDYDFSTGSPICVSNFEKKGNLNLSRVYFLVTRGTASASELTINCLEPVMDVKLIGGRTYGKPVGFFGLHIDKYDLYIPQFQTKNRNNQGDYFTGMTVDKSDEDDISKEFGDPSERYLAYALGYAQTGSFPTLSLSKTSSTYKIPVLKMNKEQIDNATRVLGRTEFKGMVETRTLFERK